MEARREIDDGARALDLDQFEESLIWIFGSGRSGSTWLMRMMRRQRDTVQVNEPGIGEHLADLRTRASSGPAIEFFRYNDLRADTPDYFFGDEYADVWKPLLRELILRRLHAHVARLAAQREIENPRVVIKEPNGSQAADIILSVLPRSGMVLLVRDGRDVVDSALASALGGSWGNKFGSEIDDSQRMPYIRHRASLWLHTMEVAQTAYDAHPDDRKILVRYEDLLADTQGWLRKIFDRFGLRASDAKVAKIVSLEAFENVPDDRKGPDKPIRAASPGLWRQNLSPAEQELMGSIMNAKLRDLGYEVDSPQSQEAAAGAERHS